MSPWLYGSDVVIDELGNVALCDACPCVPPPPPPPPCEYPPCDTVDCTDEGSCAPEFPVSPFVDMGTSWNFVTSHPCADFPGLTPAMTCGDFFNGKLYELFRAANNCSASGVYQHTCQSSPPFDYETATMRLRFLYRTYNEGESIIPHPAFGEPPLYEAPVSGWYLRIVFEHHQAPFPAIITPQWVAVYGSENCDVHPLAKTLSLGYFAGPEGGPVGPFCEIAAPPAVLGIIAA